MFRRSRSRDKARPANELASRTPPISLDPRKTLACSKRGKTEHQKHGACKRVADRRRPEPVENFRVRKQVEKVKTFPSSNPSSRAGLGQKPPPGKTKPPSVESEGWCAVCKIDCFYAKTLAIHVAGKKHQSVLEKLKEEGKTVSVSEGAKRAAKQEAKPVSSKKGTMNAAERKRENDDKVEASRSAKRLKASESADAINVTVAAAADALKGNDNEAHPVCKICNISCTGKKNLDSHLKGKKHAARLLELTEA